MLIIPHTADLNFASKPWLTWTIMALTILIHFAQESSREKVFSAAEFFCNEQFSDPKKDNQLIWNSKSECAKELKTLRSLPNPSLFLVPPKDADKYFRDTSPEEIKIYYQTLSAIYYDFEKISPSSLDANLKYDPSVINPWRMITSATAHADWWHITFNLIFFIAFSPLVELMAGRIRYIGILLLVAISEHLMYSFSVMVSGHPAATLGLSGVVFGLIGMTAYIAPRVRIRTMFWFFFYFKNLSIPAWVLAVWFVGWNITDMITDDGNSGINFVAHVSGAFAGYFAGWLLMQKQRDEYAEDIHDEIENQREKRADILGTNIHGSGNYQRIIERKQMQAAEADFESLMEDVYQMVMSENDSTAVLKLIENYDMWSVSPDIYEDIYNRMNSWGRSKTQICIGRLLIHLYAKNGLTAKAQLIASQCLTLDSSFVLADSVDIGNMIRGHSSIESKTMARQLQINAMQT